MLLQTKGGATVCVVTHLCVMRSSLFFHLGDFRFHRFDQLCELFHAFSSCF